MSDIRDPRAGVLRANGLIAGSCILALVTGCGEQGGVAQQQQQPLKPIRTSSIEPKPISAPPSAEESNIIRVNKIFDSFPWLSFASDGSGRVDGFKCAVYLEGARSTKGVFGTGTLVVSMYRLDADALGREVPTEVQCWTFTRDEAMQFRAREMKMLGWGYGLRLRWDDQVKVSGKKIAVVIKYVRDDGRVVSSSRKVLRVPIVGDSRGQIQDASTSGQPIGREKPVPKPDPEAPSPASSEARPPSRKADQSNAGAGSRPAYGSRMVE